jgi:hypothetical protein
MSSESIFPGLLKEMARCAVLACCAMSIGCAMTAGRVASIRGATTPELQALLPRVHELAETIYPKLLDLTFGKGQSSPSRFSIEMVRGAHWKGYNGITRGKNIQLDADYLCRNPEDLDVILVHEMAHVAQNYGRGTPLYWGEGMADYAKFKLGYTNYTYRCECSLERSHYMSGWACAGAFLSHVDSAYGQDVVLKLDDALRKGSYSDALFKSATGKDLESLWKEFEKTRFMPPIAVAENDLMRQLGGWPERVRDSDIIHYVAARHGTNAVAVLKWIAGHGFDEGTGVPAEMEKSDFARRYVAYAYLESPGGKLWSDAEAFLTKLGRSGHVPGWSPDIWYEGFPRGTPESYPFSVTFCAKRSEFKSCYLYQVVRSSPESDWVLTRAWKTDPDGKTIEELPLKDASLN